MGLVNLTVGEKFPAPYHKNDSMAVALDGPTFNLILSMGGITGKEAQALRKGKLRIGAAAVHHIPFVVLACPGVGTFDASLNIVAESQEKRDAFLAGEPRANLVTLYLIDNQTDILRGMRALGCSVDFMQTIKEAAFSQVAAYPSGAEVLAKIQTITAEYSTDRLISLAQMQVFR